MERRRKFHYFNEAFSVLTATHQEHGFTVVGWCSHAWWPQGHSEGMGATFCPPAPRQSLGCSILALSTCCAEKISSKWWSMRVRSNPDQENKSALFLVVPREKAPRPALPWNLAREPRTPELIHPAGFGGCFCARCPLCEAGVTFAPQTGFSRLPAACTDLHPPPWLSPHCALPAPLLQMAPALTLDFFPFQFLNERIHQTLWYSEWEEAQSGVKVVQALVPASPRKSLPPASLCSYGATAGVLLAKAAPAGYPAMLAAAPNPSPEDVTRALAYKNP